MYSGTYLSIALASEIECQTSYPLQVSMRDLFALCVGIGEHYAIVLMGNLICIYSENVNGVLRDDCKWSTLLYVMWGEFLMVMSGLSG